ncbi:MAG: F0F1 ATP synthase subunit alpha, partial [Sphingomonadales bacterium]
EMFTRFGGMTDARVKSRITRGERIRAILAQPRFARLSTTAQVALIAALNEGVLDPLPVEKVEDIRRAMDAAVGRDGAAIAARIEAGEKADPAMLDALVALVRDLVGRDGAGGQAQGPTGG